MRASPQPPERHLSLYQATVEEAAQGGAALMGRLVAAAGRALYTRELTARNVYEREALIASGKLLQSKAPDLCARYPKALLAAFGAPDAQKKAAPLSMAEVHFDQLELMDEAQVQTSVALARAQQVAQLAVDVSLADLNTLICSALGLKTVRPESNPLRPQAYVGALNEVVEQMQLPTPTRLDWLGSMSEALGQELHALYQGVSDKLRAQGVVAAGYTVSPSTAPLAAGVGVAGSVALDALPLGQPSWSAAPAQAAAHRTPGPPSHAPLADATPAAPARGEDDALLTLDKLRRLLAGEFDTPVPGGRVQDFAQQFARQFESGDSGLQGPVSDFSATVPAAFEALAEMKQVEQVVQRLEQRNDAGLAGTTDGDSSIEAIRDVLRRSATGVAQGLSLEVVTLMVDNIRRNPRLLEPVQRLVAEMEPALLLLSLVDPRFFTDKQHPARVLLQEITNRSLAYESVQASGFAEFMAILVHHVEPLSSATIENAEPFERVLAQLHQAWHQAEHDQEREREQAVRVLQHAEQRHLLAEKIARGIENHPDSVHVPEVVIDFLCGPWAQVVAQARINGARSAADKYQALISAMLWSTHPGLARKNIAKLTRLVPLLLATLREGLDTIRYPATRTSAFLETLMGLHQAVFRAASRPAQAESAPAPQALPVDVSVARAQRADGGDPWVAPEEARASNFMEWSELPALAQQGPPTAPPDGQDSGISGPLEDHPAQGSAQELPVGSWVELWVDGKWVRTQLTWASPHGTLFLFTSVLGTTQSMTRRSLDKLVGAGQLRMVSGQTVVDGALDAVAQIALRNSLEVKP